jgi:Cft2 family RNA processing exonuclease
LVLSLLFVDHPSFTVELHGPIHFSAAPTLVLAIVHGDPGSLAAEFIAGAFVDILEASPSGAKTIRIHGQDIPIAAEVRNIDALSAHGDADEVLAWLKSGRIAPRRTFITHGEQRAEHALQSRIANELGWRSPGPERCQQTALS